MSLAGLVNGLDMLWVVRVNLVGGYSFTPSSEAYKGMVVKSIIDSAMRYRKFKL